MTLEQGARAFIKDVEVLPGTSKIIHYITDGPASMAVHARGEGVSAHVELSISSDKRFKNKTEKYSDAEGFGEGGIVANTAKLRDIPVEISAVRVTATGGIVTVEMLQ